MEKQRWEESEKRREEERRSRRKSQKRSAFPDLWRRRVKSRLAKAAGAEPCGQMRDEKLHAVVARSTFPSQNVQNTSGSEHFWKLRCRKSARRCGAKHISKSKCTKHTSVRTTFGSCDVKKVHAVVARSTFRSQNVLKTTDARTTFGRSDVVLRGRRKGLCTLSKVSKT